LGRLLREDKARANEQLSDGRTPVDFAARVRSRATLKLLLQSGADPNRNDPLSRAAGDDDTETCRILIEHGARATDKAVLAAAWRNKESAVLQLVLDNGGDPDAIGPNGAALHWVAAENSQSVQLLIDAGADVNKPAQELSNSPLHSVGNNVDSATRLLAAGADTTRRNVNGDTPLDRARQRGHDDVAELLQRHTDTVNAPDSAQGRRPLQPTHEFFVAVGGLDLDRVRQLLEQDPTLVDADVWGDASIDGSWGHGPGESRGEEETARAVHFAVFKHPELLQVLIDRGADVNALGYEGNYGWAPPLVLACWEGNLETVRLLLEAGANPNIPAVPGGPALQAAINHYDDDKIQLLLKHGARHDIFSAAAVGDLDEVKRLLDEDPHRLHRQDLRRRRTPLGWAIYHEQPSIIDYLVEIGVRPLPHELISLGRLDEIKQVVAGDPEFVNRRDEGYEDGADQPLLWALRAGHTEIAQFLLSAGADPNGHGRWDIPLSTVCTDVTMSAMLIEGGADVNGDVFPGWPILAKAVTRRGFDVAELLLQKGADIDRPGGDAGQRRGGRTTLQILVRECRERQSLADTLEKMHWLLARGADANVLSDDGRTALDLQIMKSDESQYDFSTPEIEALLREHGGKRAEELPGAVSGRRLLQPTHEFFVAVGNLDLPRVRQLLEDDPTLVDADVWGDASHDGSWGHGPGQSARGEEQRARAIHFAAYKHNELMRLLIEFDADLNAPGYNGNHGDGWTSALVLACWEGNMETVRLLLEAGADPNNPSSPALSPIHCGGHFDPEKVELMQQYGARHDIYSAAAIGDVDEVKRLMASGDWPIDEPDPRRGRTPLGWALQFEQQQIVEHLLEAGATATPQEMISLGRVDDVRQLVANDPGFVQRISDGYEDSADPALLWAVRSGAPEMMELLLGAGADPNQHGRWEVPLSLATGDVEMTQRLIEAGADVNGSVFPGWTILTTAVHRRGFEMAELLLERGADVDRRAAAVGRRSGGLTALQAMVRECREPASIDDCLEKLTFLLDRGADANVVSDDGRTALDCQLEKEGDTRYDFPSPQIEALLRDHGGKRAEELAP
jgi:uncharacterized protein